MSPVSRTKPEIIEESLEHLCMIPEYAAMGLESRIVLDAIAMRLTAGLEAVRALDDQTRERLFGDDWRVMWATRNRIAHAYSSADPDVIRETIKNSVPALIARLEAEPDT